MNLDQHVGCAVVEMLGRFYGWGAERDYSKVLDSYLLKPYEPLRRMLGNFGTLDELSDPNDDVSFAWSVVDVVVQVSMVGPFAMVLAQDHSGKWKPLVESTSSEVSSILRAVSCEGFVLLDRASLELPVLIWEEQVSLFQALFSDSEPPWKL